MTNDVEKRWHDPDTMRRASWYVAVVLALTAGVVAGALLWSAAGSSACPGVAEACPDPPRVGLAVGPAAVLLIGGLGAFVRTYAVWRRGGVWPIWQGAGWLLLVLFLAYATMASGLLAA